MQPAFSGRKFFQPDICLSFVRTYKNKPYEKTNRSPGPCIRGDGILQKEPYLHLYIHRQFGRLYFQRQLHHHDQRHEKKRDRSVQRQKQHSFRRQRVFLG
jgi:hypothetical protein